MDPAGCPACRGSSPSDSHTNITIGQVLLDDLSAAPDVYNYLNRLQHFAHAIGQSERLFRNAGQLTYADLIATEASTLEVVAMSLRAVLERQPTRPAPASANSKQCSLRWPRWLLERLVG